MCDGVDGVLVLLVWLVKCRLCFLLCFFLDIRRHGVVVRIVESSGWPSDCTLCSKTPFVSLEELVVVKVGTMLGRCLFVVASSGCIVGGGVVASSGDIVGGGVLVGASSGTVGTVGVVVVASSGTVGVVVVASSGTVVVVVVAQRLEVVVVVVAQVRRHGPPLLCLLGCWLIGLLVTHPPISCVVLDSLHIVCTGICH